MSDAGPQSHSLPPRPDDLAASTAAQGGSGPAQGARASQQFEARRVALEQLLLQAVRAVERSRPMPFSTSVMINGDEILALLRRALSAMPEELREARWVLKERDDLKQRAQQEGEEIISAARARAQQMVQRSEVVKSAEVRARRIRSDAEAQATRMKLETEDWCDQRLAAFEATLHKTMNSVTAGRKKLQDTRMERPTPPPAEPQRDEDFFDQDLG